MPLSILAVKNTNFILCILLLLLLNLAEPVLAQAREKQIINALYIPLTGYYAALVAYELYREEMRYADFRIRPKMRKNRKPTEQVATIFREFSLQKNNPIEIDIPHILSTRTVALYRYLKKHKAKLNLKPNQKGEIFAIEDRILNKKVNLTTFADNRFRFDLRTRILIKA